MDAEKKAAETDQERARRLVSMYSLLNGLIAVCGLALGYVCYAKTNSSQAGWECFRATTLVAVLPALVCTTLALILYFTRKYNSAIVVSAIPLLQAVIWCVWTLAGSLGVAR